MISRKPRPWDEVVKDPGLLYATGQLVGAANVCAHLLLNQDSPDVKVIGEHLQRQVAWFYGEHREEVKSGPRHGQNH